MSVQQYARKEKLDVRTFFEDEDGNFITTALGKATIQRISDDQYWAGVGITFQAAPTSIALVKVGDTNSPGEWKFNPPLDTNGLPDDTYIFVFRDSNGNATNDPLYFTAIVGGTIVDLAEISAAGVWARVNFDEGTGVVTLYKWDDPNTPIRLFDVKDKDGMPAGLNRMFEKVPQ